MEKYQVIRRFKDLEDNDYIYDPNIKERSVYPREGLEPTKKRIKELSTEKNKIGEVLIKKIEEEAEEVVEEEAEEVVQEEKTEEAEKVIEE